MTSHPPQLGLPFFVDVANGGARCTSLARTVMQGEATRFQEDLLQQMVAENPALLPVRDFLPTTSSVHSLGREIAVDVGGKSGYIDNLLVTNEGWLVLVETKLWRNPESTREVIAQVLQYGMALSALSLREIESILNLPGQQTISNLVANSQAPLVEDFEDALERHLRRGEILYLIVADGIQFSVERITHWLNEGGSAPFKFGLVELRFFDAGSNQMLVVPRTLLKTREISRHVVMVDIQGPAAGSATASIQDDAQAASGSLTQTQRSVKATGPPMTPERLISEVAAEKGGANAAIASRVMQCLEAAPMDRRSTPSALHFGMLASEDGSFYSWVTLTASGAWSHPSSAAIAIIGDDGFVQHKLRLNQVAPFYRPEQATDATKRSNELVVGYGSLLGKEETLARAVRLSRDLLAEILSK
jgi:hypothetical protein